MRSLHAQTPVRSSFTSEPSHQSVNGRSIRSFKKKGRSSLALQFTNKLTSEELKVTGTRPLLANQGCIIYENECNLFDAIRRIARGYVVTKSLYDHEFLKNNSVTYFSQNNAVENYRKYQKKLGSTIIVAWSLIIMEWS